jgi:hypothetical protein
MYEPRPLMPQLAMPLFVGLVALLFGLGAVAAWVPTIPCADCGGSGNIRVETPTFEEICHPYRKTLLGAQFKIVPCGECQGKGRLTWVHNKLLGRIEQQPIATH